MSADSNETGTPQTCAYPGCDRTFIRKSEQGAVPKKYCSNSCRTRDYQRRNIEATNDTSETIRRAVEQALRPLSTEQVNDSLRAMPPDIRRNFEQVRRVLKEIHKRTPNSND